MEIESQDKTMAILAHLSGLAGYVIPLGGAVVPIIIWLTSSSKSVATIAKQALWLNVIAYVGAIAGAVAYFTLIGIPCAILLWTVLGVAVIALPIVGAIKASEGRYYRYPVVGLRAPLLTSG